MVDVGPKASTKRRAIASGKIFIKEDTLKVILAGKASKGDVLSVARIAAIQAAKQTSSLIPLCHLISISHVDIEFRT